MFVKTIVKLVISDGIGLTNLMNCLNRYLSSAALALFGLLFAYPQNLHADIFQWEYINPSDTSLGKRESTLLTLGGAGANPLPGAKLRQLDLQKAFLANKNLNGTDFYKSNLSQAYLYGSDLTDAYLGYADVTNADLENAVIRGAALYAQVGLTASQIYSTASYKNKDLKGVGFDSLDLRNWDFSAKTLMVRALILLTSLMQIFLEQVSEVHPLFRRTMAP